MSTSQVFGKVVFVDMFNRKNVKYCDNEEEYQAIVKKTKDACESVGIVGQQTKPYFDIDSYSEISINDEIMRIQQAFKNKKINYAMREPRAFNGKMKYSYRIYVDDVRIKAINMPRVIKMLKLDEVKCDGECIYDSSVYSSTSVLYTPYTTEKVKKQSDGKYLKISAPPLTPVDCSVFDCCASYVLESYDDSMDITFDNLRTKEKKEEDTKKEVNVEKEKPSEEKKVDSGATEQKLKSIINKLSPNRSDVYETWTKLVWCIIGICKSNGIGHSKCSKLVHLFSMKSKKYNEDEVDTFIDTSCNNKPVHSKGWKYLFECLKEDDLKFYDSINIKTYNQMKQDFETNHCKILYPPMICIQRENQESLVYSIKQCKDTYEHLHCTVKAVKKDVDVWEDKEFITLWVKDKNIRRYDTLVFNPPPLITAENEFNTWVDFKISMEPSIETERDYFAEYCTYLKNLVNNEEVANYILARYASRFQKPAYRTQVCLIIYGSEGDGKNMLLAPIYKILGKYGLALDDASKIYDKHALFEKEKLFVLINEAGGNANFNNSEVLKSRITDNELWVNPKGMDAYRVENRCDYDMTTNNLNVVKMTDESTRRFFQVETTGHYKGNIDFFNDYQKNIVNNPTAIKQIYEGLMKFDVDKVIPSGNFQFNKPITEVSLEVKKQNRDKMVYFIEELVCNNLNKEVFKITNKELFQQWSGWLAQNKITFEYNTIQFGIKLTSLLKKQLNINGMMCIKRDSSNGVNTFYTAPLKDFFKQLNGVELEKKSQYIEDEEDEE